MAEINDISGEPVAPVYGPAGEPDGEELLTTALLSAQTGSARGHMGTALLPGESEGAATAGQTQVLPDALVGTDPTQLVAAEHLRATGGASAVEKLLGLDWQPPLLGAFPAPPGNVEALRHLTPDMRRAVLRSLLSKQRGRMRHLSQMLRLSRGHDGGRDEGGEGERDEAEPQAEGAPVTHTAGIEQARGQLSAALKMLDLLEDLHSMQDYILSQMLTFSKG